MIGYPAGTLDLEKVKDALYDWVHSITVGIEAPTQIIFMDQSRALPARPCVTLKIIDGPRPVGRNGNLFFNGAGEPYNIGVQMEMTLSVQVFGSSRIKQPKALQLALGLNSSLLRQSILDNLKKAGIAVQTVGQPRNLTALEETEYEERAGFELSLGLAQNIRDQPGDIDTVNVTVDTDAGSRTKSIDLP